MITFAILITSVNNSLVDELCFSLLMRRDRKVVRLKPYGMCPHFQSRPPNDHRPSQQTPNRPRTDLKLLLLVETTYSRLGRELAETLVHNRLRYKMEIAGKSLPALTYLDKGRYSVIVFENYYKYLNMDKWNRELLDKYCREYGVGIIGFFPPTERRAVGVQVRGFPLYTHTKLSLRDAMLNSASPVLRISRAGGVYQGPLPGDDWTVFGANDTTYEPVAWGSNDSFSSQSEYIPLATVIQDHGMYDGISRVLFGSGLRFWLHRLLLLDSLSYLSKGLLSISLERQVLVDIDDIFVGETGIRMWKEDVHDLIQTQERISKLVPGFKFNLGFSGKYFHKGTWEENEGDDTILEHVDKFNWFCHMWNHMQPHLYNNETQLEYEMTLNKLFAEANNIPTNSSYSVAPHHSGVYPVHELLYTVWKKVWNIKVTSTEEYPHLRPARLRRGFIHRGIKVLPRQTCGLFTHTIYVDRYPGGRKKLDESIMGGELFQTIVYNPINVFMSHMSNYGSDRLALYTFESVFQFIRCWTNLKLQSSGPLQLAEKYFKMYPEEVDPVWGNPCLDQRHLKIWSYKKSCQRLPKFLVIGPQKTGTTALYTFLSMHPNISANTPSKETFEEIQFFNGRNYYKGLDWYMEFFKSNDTIENKIVFEKSATYFDSDIVPKRVQALLPNVKLITILVSPAKRAYSWYQHAKAHGDPTTLKYSFHEIITANETVAPKSLRDLRNRCLNPGKYALHIERWLDFFHHNNLHIIDGEQLKSNPVDILEQLQKFLKVSPMFDYSSHIRYDVKKHFFCKVLDQGGNKCLGKGKGRQYPPMDANSYKYLREYYMPYNTALVKLLRKLEHKTIPQWLKEDLSYSST
ncbi:bifunctional heparan sulfate N-deacetylase/N-sulfotransferase isoform X2 [Daktulosphaira vitifoliae]|uniref:bifunctional heparan sulfate N-deacetylase/N-sulfotransferase isoform X1 n=2 Tax=Daktulosphaira vitifoliae TaxID=58002 RepID=UPI0021A9AC3F|nr:bifunctional heparan sulfate N-deacetylase/N-sulfotransferase isoform X1 [Daktulosphaira vitifoliae]XP_050538994.1 bifunctional heparan sulfate N-deacetylase/N-sulfotransferase isoform X2 [Daktulosphaira vitifoliae]